MVGCALRGWIGGVRAPVHASGGIEGGDGNGGGKSGGGEGGRGLEGGNGGTGMHT